MIDFNSPIAGADDKISSLRSRYDRLSSSIARFESRLSKQNAQFARINKHMDYDDDLELEEDAAQATAGSSVEDRRVTVEDIRKEEEEVKELEKKKRSLEDRVSGMEKDLGGLLR